MQLPLAAKIGQMMVVGFSGLEPSAYIQDFIAKRNLGGIILFARNVANPRQVFELNKEIQAQASRNPWGQPLWICLDQEGGSVTRLNEGVSLSPGNMNLAAGSTPQQVEEICAIIAKELKLLGFNLNLAPMGSLSTNPDNLILGVRTFGSNAEIVKDYVVASVRGYQKEIAAVVKGFPGHGDAKVDAHKGLSSVSHDQTRLETVELKPFLAALAAQVEAVMTTHVHFSQIDPEYRSSSLSQQVIDGYLRGRYNYSGLVITDCMEMKAVANEHDMGEAAVLAVEAGADLILISHTPACQEAAFQALLEAVKSGRISENRLDQSLARIEVAKKRYASLTLAKPDFCLIGAQENIAVMQQAAYRGITLVRDRTGNLPLQGESLYVVEPKPAATNQAEDVLVSAQTLGDSLAKFGYKIEQHLYELEQEIELDLSKCRLFDQIIFVTQDSHCRLEQAVRIKQLAANSKNLIVVGSRTPYEINLYPEVETYLCTYSNQPFVWDELVKILRGKEAVGTLPVRLEQER